MSNPKEGAWWLLRRLTIEFPGLLTDEDVNGAELIEFLTNQLDEMEDLKNSLQGDNK